MKYRKHVPSISALAAFESAARLTSFTLAARGQMISQPAISRHIDNLEKRLDCVLFERTNNRIRLTSAGRRLHHAVTTGLDEILLVIREISQIDTLKVYCQVV